MVPCVRQEIPDSIINDYLFHWSYDRWGCIRTAWWYFWTKKNTSSLFIFPHSPGHWNIFFNVIRNVYSLEIFHWVFYPGRTFFEHDSILCLLFKSQKKKHLQKKLKFGRSLAPAKHQLKDSSSSWNSYGCFDVHITLYWRPYNVALTST